MKTIKIELNEHVEIAYSKAEADFDRWNEVTHEVGQAYLANVYTYCTRTQEDAGYGTADKRKLYLLEGIEGRFDKYNGSLKMKKSVLIFMMMMSLYLVACDSDGVKEGAIEKNDLMQMEHEETEQLTELETENLSNRIFESGTETSFYFSMRPVDEGAYDLLKAEYDKVDFTAKFEKGSESTFAIYSEKYKQFMNNEITFWDANGVEGYLKDIVLETDMENSHFYIFDVDGDDLQELYLRTPQNRVYVFKYREDDEKIHVWYQEKNTPYYYFVGTLEKAWSNGGDIYQFYKLDEDANEEITVTFEQFYDLNPVTQEGEIVYMVRLPKYTDENSKVEMAEELKKQAYCIDGEYYFCVTKAQFDELTARFFQINEKLTDALAEVEIR